MIRPMTTDEIRRALRRGAQVCYESRIKDCFNMVALPADDAFIAADAFAPFDYVTTSPEHSANFLLLVAEALEC
jgi:hypothetical protein